MAEYAELISSTHRSFSIDDDIGALARISTSLIAARSLRLRRRQDSKSALTDLSRTLDAHRLALDTLRDARAGCDHGALMNALDREKFGLAKGINDLESATHNLEASLHRIKYDIGARDDNNDDDATDNGDDDGVVDKSGATLQGRGRSDAPAYRDAADGTVLKLSVYRDLGITLRESEEDGVPGRYVQAIVRRGTKDVRLIALDQDRPGSQCDQLWDLCT